MRPHNGRLRGNHSFAKALAVGATVAAAAVIVSIIAGAGKARGHEVKSITGQPLGITYPSSCCNSAATSPYGDCAPISDRYVKEGRDGYHIDLPVGAHPKLITKGYVGVVPYGTERPPISNDYAICLSTDGAHRYCFFPKPGSV